MSRFAPSRRSLLLAVPATLALGLLGCAPEPEAPSRPSPSPAPEPDPAADGAPPTEAATLLLASLAHRTAVAVIDPARPDAEAVREIEVGAAPWGVGVHTAADGASTGYVATAEGLAVVDLAVQDPAAARRTALVPYLHPAARIGQGEYRPGGLGLAVAPDGSRVYVAVMPDTGAAFLEVFDTASAGWIGSVPVGTRPFDVLVAPDGSWAASVDHDSFTVTVVDAETLAVTTHEVAPFGTEGGLASWEKTHYGVVEPAGTILLPVQGQVIVRLDPRSGRTETISSAANSHAHGTALAGTRLLTVGTGDFGSATGGPNLSVRDIAVPELSGTSEWVVPLRVPHETVAVWRDAAGAEFAAVAGGNTREEGWDGITLVPLDAPGAAPSRELPVPGYPQAIVSFPGQ